MLCGFWLQLVSLFPPTYQGHANGNRIDIMEKLAAMRTVGQLLALCPHSTFLTWGERKLVHAGR